MNWPDDAPFLLFLAALLWACALLASGSVMLATALAIAFFYLELCFDKEDP